MIYYICNTNVPPDILSRCSFVPVIKGLPASSASWLSVHYDITRQITHCVLFNLTDEDKIIIALLAIESHNTLDKFSYTLREIIKNETLFVQLDP